MENDYKKRLYEAREKAKSCSCERMYSPEMLKILIEMAFYEDSPDDDFEPADWRVWVMLSRAMRKF